MLSIKTRDCFVHNDVGKSKIIKLSDMKRDSISRDAEFTEEKRGRQTRKSLVDQRYFKGHKSTE